MWGQLGTVGSQSSQQRFAEQTFYPGSSVQRAKTSSLSFVPSSWLCDNISSPILACFLNVVIAWELSSQKSCWGPWSLYRWVGLGQSGPVHLTYPLTTQFMFLSYSALKGGCWILPSFSFPCLYPSPVSVTITIAPFLHLPLCLWDGAFELHPQPPRCLLPTPWIF